MIKWTKNAILRLLRVDFIRFCMVGGSGFFVNFAILYTLHRMLSLPLFISQLIGAEIALTSNASLHHYWTYKGVNANKTYLGSLIQFHLTSWPAIVGSAFMVDGGVRYMHLTSFTALIFSSAIVLVWNYSWSKYVIWRDISPQEIN